MGNIFFNGTQNMSLKWMDGMLELIKYATLAIRFSVHEHWKGCEVSSGVILEFFRGKSDLQFC